MEREIVRIAIIDDNIFYNKLVSNWISNYLEKDQLHHFKAEIKSVFDVVDLDLDHDFFEIAFIDYYLNENTTAIDLIDLFKSKQPDCKVIVTSQSFTDLTAYYTIDKGADGFLYKGDKELLQKKCEIISDLISEKAC